MIGSVRILMRRQMQLVCTTKNKIHPRYLTTLSADHSAVVSPIKPTTPSNTQQLFKTQMPSNESVDAKKINSDTNKNKTSTTGTTGVNTDTASAVEEDDKGEDIFALGPGGIKEWNGPTRGGTKPEPTRFGDWERNGRAVDF